ncbi:MAG TPA: FAD-dependent oxidoreductase, partial [Thermoleophilia bacterium]|nr:FAD-dependent oxidoreductase [Thermoleophilia bacterium]
MSAVTRTEVLVIGGGIVGTSCAFYLARSGREVTLIEREDSICPVEASSYGNAGLIMPSDPYPVPVPGVLGRGLAWLLDDSSPLYIKPRLDPRLARWLLLFSLAAREAPMRRSMPTLRALGEEGIAAYEELDALGELDAGYTHNGILSLYLSQRSFDSAVADGESLQALGVTSEAIDAEGVGKRVPAALPGVAGGVFAPEDAHVDPCALTRQLAQLAQKHGATVATATEAVGFDCLGRRIVAVATTRGRLEAEQVVLAAGVWSADLGRRLGLDLPVVPAKGYNITIPRPEGVPEVHPLFLPEGHVCVTPFGDELRLAGTLELSGMNRRILPNRLDGIQDGAARFLCGVAGAERLGIWRGLRPMTPDGLPIIGR